VNAFVFQVLATISQASPTPAASPIPGDVTPALTATPLATPLAEAVTPLSEAVADPGFAVRLLEFIVKGGPVMIPMILLAFVVIVLIVERYLYLRQINKGSTQFSVDFFRLWDAGNRVDAHTLAKKHDGAIARMMAGALGSLERGKQAIREAMQEQALDEMPALNRFMSAIGTIGTIMPIMGLLGTVTGMIKTFEVITVKGTGDPKALAGGISEALITTQTGLIFAIPILLFHTFLAARIDRYLNEMEKNATRLLAGLKDQGNNGA